MKHGAAPSSEVQLSAFTQNRDTWKPYNTLSPSPFERRGPISQAWKDPCTSTRNERAQTLAECIANLSAARITVRSVSFQLSAVSRHTSLRAQALFISLLVLITQQAKQPKRIHVLKDSSARNRFSRIKNFRTAGW